MKYLLMLAVALSVAGFIVLATGRWAGVLLVLASVPLWIISGFHFIQEEDAQ